MNVSSGGAVFALGYCHLVNGIGFLGAPGGGGGPEKISIIEGVQHDIAIGPGKNTERD